MQLSKEKRERIAEQILGLLYESFPTTFFTATLAKELARDEEFTKSMLFELKDKGLITAIKKNPKGMPYSRRIRWRLSNKAYKAYKQHHSLA